MYKEVHEPMDIAESEKRGEEAIALQESQEPLEENARAQALKKHKWDLLTRMFYDPEGAASYAHKHEQEKRQEAKGGDNRLNTPNTSGEPPAGLGDDKYTALTPEYWKKPFLDIYDLHVLKMPRVLQALFYLLKYDREQIAECGTNKLDFKKAKSLINDDLFVRMSEYNPLGA